MTTEPQTSKNSRTLRSWIGFGLRIFAIVGSVAGLYWWAWQRIRSSGCVMELGQAGDAIAPLTGMFSALALGAAVWSVSIQRKELHLLINEQQESRKVLEKQEAAQAEQASLLKAANKLSVKMIDSYEANTRAISESTIANIRIEKNRIQRQKTIDSLHVNSASAKTAIEEKATASEKELDDLITLLQGGREP